MVDAIRRPILTAYNTPQVDPGNLRTARPDAKIRRGDEVALRGSADLGVRQFETDHQITRDVIVVKGLDPIYDVPLLGSIIPKGDREMQPGVI
jgi:hypothetical protein